jgi:alginate O-acetyltransferase complex protein AlgI
VIDVYRRKWTAAKNPCDVALYIFFFPQLIAGPILRWSAIAPQLAKRVITRQGFADGVRRFSEGLAKKVLVANAVAVPADQIFAFPGKAWTPVLAWFGTLCYTVQIYFDFSGYSDMAVGLGKMFGFQFLENFNFPYISQSIREFWRRWHMSLSGWFRDYLYIPMGGNRCSENRNYLNLVIVFFLCGLWHGASWTFVIWGLYHGIFLVVERTRFGSMIDSQWRPLRHAYTLLAVIVGWVLFRAETFSQAANFLENMAGFSSASAAAHPLARYLTEQVGWSIALGVIFSIPVWPWLRGLCERKVGESSGAVQWVAHAAGGVFQKAVLVLLLISSAARLAGGTYNQYIY